MTLRKVALLVCVAVVSVGCVRIPSGHQGVLFKLWGGTQADFFGEGRSPKYYGAFLCDYGWEPREL